MKMKEWNINIYSGQFFYFKIKKEYLFISYPTFIIAKKGTQITIFFVKNSYFIFIEKIIF